MNDINWSIENSSSLITLCFPPLPSQHFRKTSLIFRLFLRVFVLEYEKVSDQFTVKEENTVKFGLIQLISHLI